MSAKLRGGGAKNVLITGAGAGIGRAAAELFLAKGWRVGAFDIDAAAVADLADKHRADGGVEDRLVVGALDIRSAEGWEAALREFCGPDGRLDVLVNNAGILVEGFFSELALERQLAVIDVNVKGLMVGCHTAYPYLSRAGRADVVNMASASAIYGQKELAAYSASKFAVRGMTEALDLEWAPQGIRVQAIWPLFVRTSMTEGLDIGTTRALGVNLLPPDVAAQILKAVSRPRALSRITSVHRAVGRDTVVTMAGAAVSPSFVMRKVNAFLGNR